MTPEHGPKSLALRFAVSPADTTAALPPGVPATLDVHVAVPELVGDSASATALHVTADLLPLDPTAPLGKVALRVRVTLSDADVSAPVSSEAQQATDSVSNAVDVWTKLRTDDTPPTSDGSGAGNAPVTVGHPPVNAAGVPASDASPPAQAVLAVSASDGGATSASQAVDVPVISTPPTDGTPGTDPVPGDPPPDDHVSVDITVEATPTPDPAAASAPADNTTTGAADNTTGATQGSVSVSVSAAAGGASFGSATP